MQIDPPPVLPPISKMTDSLMHSSPSSLSSSSPSPFSPPRRQQQQSQHRIQMSSTTLPPQPRDYSHMPGVNGATSVRQDYYRNEHPNGNSVPGSSHYSQSYPPEHSGHPPPGPQQFQPQQTSSVNAWYGQAAGAPRSGSAEYTQSYRDSTDYSADSRRGSITSVDSMQYTTSSQRGTSPKPSGGSIYSSGGKPAPRVAPRVAPPVFSYQYAPHPNAPSPTKGFPYAFPDPGSLPPAQTQHYGYQSNASTVPYQQPPRSSVDSYDRLSVRSLDLDESGSTTTTTTTGAGPYSRSPELRQTHKIAERKRRRDMSLLYDDLKEILPEEKGVKSSKHEILSRAINAIKKLQRNNDDLRQEVNELRSKLGMPPKKAIQITGRSSSSGPRMSSGASDNDEPDSSDDRMDESK
ncbi:hypothetical protein V1511DRAFT_461044 [Dipodascopsis uninucleata]